MRGKALSAHQRAPQQPERTRGLDIDLRCAPGGTCRTFAEYDIDAADADRAVEIDAEAVVLHLGKRRPCADQPRGALPHLVPQHELEHAGEQYRDESQVTQQLPHAMASWRVDSET